MIRRLTIHDGGVVVKCSRRSHWSGGCNHVSMWLELIHSERVSVWKADGFIRSVNVFAMFVCVHDHHCSISFHILAFFGSEIMRKKNHLQKVMVQYEILEL